MSATVEFEPLAIVADPFAAVRAMNRMKAAGFAPTSPRWT